jgi:hypothetical protein
MKPKTNSFLQELKSCNCFARVGHQEGDDKVVWVSSWKEAIKKLDSKPSRFAAVESRNLLTERLCFQFKERYREWNRITLETKKVLVPIVNIITGAPKKQHNLPKEFVDYVSWDLLAACMEFEYADIVPPRYFAERAKWYLAGHFPCGWEGEFPEGRLIVF